MEGAALAELRDVVKDYPLGIWSKRKLRALDGVSLRLARAEVFGLLGPNRAGKTTLVKLLLSLCKPTAGHVLRFGKPAAHRSTLQRIGYVHENQAFPRYLTATGLLEYYGALSLLTEPQVKAKVPRLLDLVGLADRAREPISRFSKGMVQRLGIAQALLTDPDLLVLDEPSEGLDLSGRQLVRNLVAQQKQRGAAVLFVSHVLPEVERLCDRIGVLVSGKLVFQGTIAELKQHTGAATLEDAVRRYYPAASEPASSIPNQAQT